MASSRSRKTKRAPALSCDGWEPIPGWPSYFAHRDGYIKRSAGGRGRWGRMKEKLLTISGSGRHVTLVHPKRKQCSVAYLILLTFKGPPPLPYGKGMGYSLARHLNDIPHQNHLENLAWGTDHDNTQDAIKNGRQGKGSPARRKAALKMIGRKMAPEAVAKSVASKKANREMHV